MRIIHVFHHYRPCIGGVENVIFELNRVLTKKGHKCKVICLDKCAKSGAVLPRRQMFDEAVVERLPFIDLGFYKFAPFGLHRLAEADVVHVHGLGFFFDFLALTSFLHRKPLVLSTHGGIFHTEKLSLVKKVYFFIWCRVLIKLFGQVVAVSQPDFELFRKILPSKKILLIENPVDVRKFTEIKTVPGENNFLFVGRLSRNKGLPELLKTFECVKKENPNFKLRIVGREFDLSKEDLEKKIADLGLKDNVEILGEINDRKLKEVYMISGVFVSASHYEGFGVSALEGMAAGLIPVLNKIGSFEGFISRDLDKKNGFIVNFGNAEKAAEKILDIMNFGKADRKALSENAKEFALGFEAGKKAAEYEKAYEAVLKGSGVKHG